MTNDYITKFAGVVLSILFLLPDALSATIALANYHDPQELNVPIRLNGYESGTRNPEKNKNAVNSSKDANPKWKFRSN